MITHEPNPIYVASPERYTTMKYKRCGRSGVQLSRLSLGLWQNFGAVDSVSNARAMLRKAFDLGINHFDLANNYGPTEQYTNKILHTTAMNYLLAAKQATICGQALTVLVVHANIW